MRHVETKMHDEHSHLLGPVTVLYVFYTDIPPDDHMLYGFAFSDAPAFYRRTPYSPWRPWNRDYDNDSY